MSETHVSHPIFARFWTLVSPSMDRGGAAEYRRRLLAGLSGRVLEVGAGNGLNFAHYPTEVTHVLAVEPESHLRQAGRANTARDTAAAIAAAGFVTEHLERVRFPDTRVPMPTSPHIIGAARRG